MNAQVVFTWIIGVLAAIIAHQINDRFERLNMLALERAHVGASPLWTQNLQVTPGRHALITPRH